jgi:uroporphyrinogen III methyltransferase/synthase
MSASPAGKGKVWLVGAGPGDPGLLTVKGAQALAEAEVVVYDRLASPALLALAPASAERVPMGKEPETPGAFQAQINDALVRHALAGKRVVRLKGGDPFVFGRGGEEAEAVRAAGVDYEIVPGITSAIAVPAYAGIPVTHRGVSTSFTVVTGSEDPTKPDASVDWAALAKVSGTLVVLMGWRALPHIVEALIAAGKPADTPVGLVSWGTTPRQRTVTGTLADIVERGKAGGISNPVITVIGPVAGLREGLAWFDQGPLFGMRVLVTRSRQQASALSAALREAGAEPVEVPTIAIEPLDAYGVLDDALRRLSTYGWAVFTSQNAVEAVFERLEAAGRDARAFADVQIGAVGPATARALAVRGLRADYVPERFTTQAVADGFRAYDLNKRRVLLPRADIAPATLPQALAAQGALVDDVPAYRTVTPDGAAAQARALLAEGVDAVTVASSSAVRNLLGLLDDDASALRGVAIASIGPETSRAVREAGLEVAVEATEHTIPGLVAALVAAAPGLPSAGGAR